VNASQATGTVNVTGGVSAAAAPAAQADIKTGEAGSYHVSVAVPAIQSGTTITVPLILGTDDAGIDPGPLGFPECFYATSSNEIYFGRCRNGSPITSGFRFQHVQIPLGAVINEAHLAFTVDGPYANEIAVQFFGQRSANASTFTSTDRPSNRPLTNASVSWAISASDVWNLLESRRSPNVAAIVQEIVDLPGWASGNSMAIIVRADPAIAGNTHRRVIAWEREDNSVHTARLVVTYGGGPTPTPNLVAAPTSVPADGVSTSTVTLSNAPVGHQVRLISSRGSVDAFSPISGITDASGRFVATVRSSTPGTAIITARDLTTGQAFATSAQVTFTGMGGPPPPNIGAVEITDVRSEHRLDARYLQGIPVSNRIDVTVDWKGSSPGRVDFMLNGVAYSEPASASGASHTFNMGKDLRAGRNTLRVVAYNGAGQASDPQNFAPWSTLMSVWMVGLSQAGLASLPVLASGDLSGRANYEMGFHLPPYKFDIAAPGFGVPDGETELGFDFTGKLSIPLFCLGPYEASLSAGFEKGFKFLGTKLEATITGSLRSDPIGLCVWELPRGSVEFEVEATRNIYRKPVLVMVAYFNAAVGLFVEQTIVILHIEELVSKVLGEFYIDGKAHIGLDADVAFADSPPYFQFSNLGVAGGIGIEGGYRYELPVVEIKVWAGADGSVKFIRMGPINWPITENWTFDSITLKGEVGARFRAGWFEREAKGEIEWKYPPTALAIDAVLHDVATSDWHLIRHIADKEYAIFRARPGMHQAFAPTTAGLQPPDIAAQTTVTSLLVSNVYTYPEPSLAVNPSNDNALLLWVHDVVTKPVGQSHEIAFSRWNGSSWSVPASVTNDNLLDGAPRVAWAGNGNGVAVWQRLNDTLPITATWDVTTAKKIEIATSVYSPTTGAWSPVSLLTSNTALDMKPQLARNNAGILLAVWRQNDAGLLGGTVTQADRIIYTFYNGNWSAPAIAVDAIPGLVDLAPGYGNSAATIAYTRYVTPTGYPTPTLQLFTSIWNSSAWTPPVQRTDDSLGHRNPQVIYNGANQPLLVWLAGNELRLQNLATSATVTLTLDSGTAIDEFRIVQDSSGNIAAVFTAQGSQRDVYLAFYDQSRNTWSKPKQLTNDRASEAYPTAALDSTGRLLMSYAATAIASVTNTTTISGTGEVVTFTIPTEGQTDLLTLSHVFTRNLTLDSLAISTDHPTPGSNVIITATLLNSGDLAVSNAGVAFYDGDPSAGGVLIRNVTLPTTLAGGFTATLATTYTVPLTGGARILYAVADPANAIPESSEADNTATLAAFGPDLEMANAGVDYWGGTDVGLITLIRNIGTTDAPTATLAFYRDAITGTLVATDTVPSLAAGQSITLTTPWNFGTLGMGTYPLVAIANRTGFTETFTANNAFRLTLDVLPDLAVSPYYLWTTSPTATTVLITATLYNFGPITATNVEVGFYGDDRLSENSPLFTRTVTLLPPAGSATLTGQIAGPVECTLYAYIDPNHLITELTRSNNLAGISYRGLCQRVYLPLILRIY